MPEGEVCPRAKYARGRSIEVLRCARGESGWRLRRSSSWLLLCSPFLCLGAPEQVGLGGDFSFLRQCEFSRCSIVVGEGDSCCCCEVRGLWDWRRRCWIVDARVVEGVRRGHKNYVSV